MPQYSIGADTFNMLVPMNCPLYDEYNASPWICRDASIGFEFHFNHRAKLWRVWHPCPFADSWIPRVDLNDGLGLLTHRNQGKSTAKSMKGI